MLAMRARILTSIGVLGGLGVMLATFAPHARAEDPNAPLVESPPICNPPCGANFTCGAGGQCLQSVVPVVEQTTSGTSSGYPAGNQPPPTQPYPSNTQQPYAVQPPVQYQYPTAPTQLTLNHADPGWAVGAGVTGLVAAGVVFGLAIGSAIANDSYDYDISRILGGSATVLLAVMGPVVAAGGGSARGSHPDVRGATALRVVGWVLYGISLALAVVSLAIAIALDGDIPTGVIYGLGAGAALSLTAFSLDAFIAAGQADGINEQAAAPPTADGVRVAPFASVRPTAEGGALGVIGLAGAF